MLRRILLLALAVTVVAWLAVMVRDTYYLNQAGSGPQSNLRMLVTNVRTPGGFARVRDDLHKAQLLEPDTSPRLAVAADYVLLAAIPGAGAATIRDAGNQALRIAQAVTRDEPQNVQAWEWVLQAQVLRHDIAGEQAATAHIRKLDPLSLSRS
jgi:hypothetical protein